MACTLKMVYDPIYLYHHLCPSGTNIYLQFYPEFYIIYYIQPAWCLGDTKGVIYLILVIYKHLDRKEFKRLATDMQTTPHS